MGKKTKTGKNRLDKFYQLAKDTGYRARSAFKILQLASKFSLFEKNVAVCVDLCGAPGGWSQVAVKYIPDHPSKRVICVDLAPIKPIRGVITLQNDITTESCRLALKKEIGVENNYKADLIMNDGAPNVGGNWAKDAYSQAELTLHATKLASEFLREGGTYVTKVFRSGDSNSLLWVFNQLFERVESTKPSSSRGESAEIFVCCFNFKGGKIDPKFFNPHFVFVQDYEGDDASTSPEDLRRLAGDLRLSDWISKKWNKNAVEYLNVGTGYTLKIDIDEINTNSSLMTDEIRNLCSDLKVISKGDFQKLAKWRWRAIIALGLHKNTENNDLEKGDDNDDMTEMDEILHEQMKREKKQSRKQKEKERKAELRSQMSSGVFNDLDGDKDLFSLDTLRKLSNEEQIDSGDGEQVADQEDDETSGSEETSESIHSDLDDDELADLFTHGDESKPLPYEKALIRAKQKSRLMESDDYIDSISREIEETEKINSLAKSHLSDIGEVKDSKKEKKNHQTRRERVYAEWAKEMTEFNEGLDEVARTVYVEAGGETKKDSISLKDRVMAERFLDNPIFKELSEKEVSSLLVKTDKEKRSEKRKKLEERNLKKAEKRKALEGGDLEDELPEIEKDKKSGKKDKKTNEKTSGKIELVSREDEELNDSPYQFNIADFDGLRDKGETDADLLAKVQTIGTMMVNSTESRSLLLESGINRYNDNGEDDLPSWFLDDEKDKRKPIIPLNKEMYQMYRQKLKEINSRPIRKVAEAKGRQKKRNLKQIVQMQNAVDAITTGRRDGDLGDLSAASKTRQIKKTISKAARGAGQRKNVIVRSKKAGGNSRISKNKKVSGGGKLKMVDKRLKADKRGERLSAKRKKTSGKKR